MTTRRRFISRLMAIPIGSLVCLGLPIRHEVGSLRSNIKESKRLMYIQLIKSGVRVDPWTLAEVFDLPNFGPPPKGANPQHHNGD